MTIRTRCRLVLAIFLAVFLAEGCRNPSSKIDRKGLTDRNSPVVTGFDSLSSLSVGNGDLAFTVDATGLQTFPLLYREGVCLGTQSSWGWHAFPNPEGYRDDEARKEYDFGRGRMEPYSVQDKGGTPRTKAAVDYLRANPHRLHLGTVGLDCPGATPADFTGISQRLDLWNGIILSRFSLLGKAFEVTTLCHPDRDQVAARIVSERKPGIVLRFPYPTGAHADDACNWDAAGRHTTELLEMGPHDALILRTLDSTQYYVSVHWEESGALVEREPHTFALTSAGNRLTFSVTFSPERPTGAPEPFRRTLRRCRRHWQDYWNQGGAVDFSRVADPRARELERRVVLSQYLLAIQCAGATPPQETGLTYNSWFGKYHLEMILWHQAQFATWGHPELLQRTLRWYASAEGQARSIAHRQGFEGIRWMKMTDPSGREAPSSTGSFLIWQQPHFIYLSELLYRAGLDGVLEENGRLVDETARFMADFADWDPDRGRYRLNHVIPAQETLPAGTTFNPPFELSFWHLGLRLAGTWRERRGLARDPKQDDVLAHLSPLAEADGKYLAAESAPDSFENPRLYSDHMAVLGAYGLLPDSPLVKEETMLNTLRWVLEHWNWDHTWGWDYPMTAMCCARLGEPEKAVDALLMERTTNTFLSNGHNYQSARLRCYLPGNGALLLAVGMMCAGWDGSTGPHPGFPGNWDVRYEGMLPLP